jgi:hypothetical protein
MGVFREESVSGMDGFYIGDFSGAYDSGNIKVAFTAGGLTDAYCFIGKTHVQGIPVGLRINSYRPDSKIFARPDDPEGNLTTISD